MRPLEIASLLFALILMHGSGAASADEVRGARFAVPQGWVASDHQGSRVVVPASLAKDELMMGVVLGAQPVTGTPAAKLEEIARAFNADARVLSTGTLETVPHGAAGTLYHQVFEVSSTAVGKHTRLVAILVREQRCAAMVFLISDAAALEKYAAGMQALLASLDIGGPQIANPPPQAGIPIADTPDKYPGSTGFRPSGRGVAVPAARVVNGRPEGLWWSPQVRGGRTVAQRVIYLPDGTCATAPRPGGPLLFDLEGQRRLGGVGTCSVTNRTLTRTIDGHTQSGAFSSGRDAEGAFMDIGGMRHRPLAPVDARFLVGTWTSPGNTYTFRADGTYVSGNLTDVSAIGQGGDWAAEGYTLFVRPSGGLGWVSAVGASTGDSLVIDSIVYQRRR